MKFLVIDTESSGLPIYHDADGKTVAADDPRQPRLASFALTVLALDEKGDGNTVFAPRQYLVRPDGWAMTAEASAVNHLTDDFLMQHGEPVRRLLDLYAAFILDGCVVVAFNAQHDLKIMRGELRRLYPSEPGRDLFEQTKNTCLMRCWAGAKIPKANGKGGYPQLADVYRYLFGQDIPGQHTALGDCVATAHILPEAIKRGVLIAPAVHYAKEKSEGAARSSRGPGF
jgi:DNA polymerase III epsilon subunit-like protein